MSVYSDSESESEDSLSCELRQLSRNAHREHGYGYNGQLEAAGVRAGMQYDNEGFQINDEDEEVCSPEATIRAEEQGAEYTKLVTRAVDEFDFARRQFSVLNIRTFPKLSEAKAFIDSTRNGYAAGLRIFATSKPKTREMFL